MQQRSDGLLALNAVKRSPIQVLPPTRNGVGPSRVVLPQGSWSTIAEFLLERFPAVAEEIWVARMVAGEVIDEFGVPVDRLRRYEPQLGVYYYRALDEETRIPFEETMLFQDEFLVVADKPHFLPTIPSGRYVQETLLVRLKRRLGIDTLAPILIPSRMFPLTQNTQTWRRHVT